MGFVELLSKFFESIFSSSSPDSKRKHELRLIETRLKTSKPLLYNKGAVQVNFADALHIL